MDNQTIYVPYVLVENEDKTIPRLYESFGYTLQDVIRARHKAMETAYSVKMSKFIVVDKETKVYKLGFTEIYPRAEGSMGYDLREVDFSEPIYTAERIKSKWLDYQKAKGWRVLRGGKWKFYTAHPDTTDGATRVEMVKVKDHMSFPKYLEVYDA